jgi:hypothetical protein
MSILLLSFVFSGFQANATEDCVCHSKMEPRECQEFLIGCQRDSNSDLNIEAANGGGIGSRNPSNASIAGGMAGAGYNPTQVNPEIKDALQGNNSNHEPTFVRKAPRMRVLNGQGQLGAPSTPAP